MTILQSKKVSVIVPNYNYARYINKRIDSIVKQTYPIYELIVLDDCSMDNSVEVIERKLSEVQRKYPDLKTKFVKNEKNSGKAMAQWKKGFELAEGDYIWIAEADDLSSRHFLEEVMKGFDDPEVVLSYAESMIINSWGLILAPNFRWSRDKEKTGHYKQSYTKKGIDEIKEIMAVRCTIPNVSGVVFRNIPALIKCANQTLDYRQVGDWYLYLQLLSHGHISYNRRALNKFRLHGKSATDRGEVHLKEVIVIHEMLKDKYKFSDDVQKRMANEEMRIRKKYGII